MASLGNGNTVCARQGIDESELNLEKKIQAFSVENRYLHGSMPFCTLTTFSNFLLDAFLEADSLRCQIPLAQGNELFFQ